MQKVREVKEGGWHFQDLSNWACAKWNLCILARHCPVHMWSSSGLSDFTSLQVFQILWMAPSSIYLCVWESWQSSSMLFSFKAHIQSTTKSVVFSWKSLSNLSLLSPSPPISPSLRHYFNLSRVLWELPNCLPIPMLASSNLFSHSSQVHFKTQLLSFPSSKVLQLFPLDLKLKTNLFRKSCKAVCLSPASTPVSCCPVLVFLSPGLVSDLWARQASCHRPLNLLFFRLEQSSFMSSPTEFLLCLSFQFGCHFHGLHD